MLKSKTRNLTQAQVQHARSKYKDRMLQVAFVASGWSPEPEGQRHGCVLAVDGKYIVATGFNGPDRYWAGHDCGGTCCRAPVVHAEVNALINLRELAQGQLSGRCIAYVTKKPCHECMVALNGAGIEAVFWLQDVGEDRGQWIK